MDSSTILSNGNGRISSGAVISNGKANGNGHHATPLTSPSERQQHCRRSGFLKNFFSSIKGGQQTAENDTNSEDQRRKSRRSKSSTSAGRQHGVAPGTVQIRTVEIVKRPGQNLGFYLRDGNGVDRVGGVFVSRIADHSPLARNNLIKTGDEILAVNSMPTSSMKIEDCVYIISLSSKLLITVRTVPFDPKHSDSNGNNPSNGFEFDATPNPIVVNHHQNNRQREIEAALNNNNKKEPETISGTTVDKISPSSTAAKSFSAAGGEQQRDQNCVEKVLENGNGDASKTPLVTSPQKSRSVLSDSDSVLSSSTENVHMTTLQKMEQSSQFATLPKKVTPTSTSPKNHQETEPIATHPLPPLQPLPAVITPAATASTSSRGLPTFFGQKPQRFRSVEEFIMSGTESEGGVDSYSYDNPPPVLPRRLLMPGSRRVDSQQCSNNCTCNHRQQQRSFKIPNNFEQHSSATPNYRGLVRPSLPTVNLSCSNLLTNDPTIGSNCYNCIRFGLLNCPNHSVLIQQQPAARYQFHHRGAGFCSNNGGYVSDCGETTGGSRVYAMMNQQPRISTIGNHRGRHQHFVSTPYQPLGCASSSGDVSYANGDTDGEEQQQIWCRQQQPPQFHCHPIHHGSASAIATIRRPSCLEVGHSNDEDEHQIASEDFELLKSKRNGRLQLLLMQQQQQIQDQMNKKNSRNLPSSATYSTFVNYKRVQSFASSPDYTAPSEPSQVSGQLTLNLQAFYWNYDADSNSDSNDMKSSQSALNNDNGSLLSSLYCSVVVDGRTVGKTAARIGLKSFYFNEMFVTNLTANRYITFTIYNYCGTTKQPQQRASALCSLAQLCRKENSMKTAVPTYPSGVIFLRWLLKGRPSPSPSISVPNQQQEQQPIVQSVSPVRTLITNNELTLGTLKNNNTSVFPPSCPPPPPPFYEQMNNSSSSEKIVVIPGPSSSNSGLDTEDFLGRGAINLTIRGGVTSSPPVLSSRRVFGVPLGELVDSEWKLGLLSCHVPILVQLCIRILNTCANVEGLYSRTSPQDERQYLRECFEQTLEPKHLPYLCEKLMKFDCRVVSDLLLDFFEELPEALFPCQLAEDLANHFRNSSEMPYVDRQMIIRQFLFECAPKYVTETFQTLIDHIFLLSVNSTANLLNSHKLDSMFSPYIFSFSNNAKQRGDQQQTDSSSGNNIQSGAEQSSLLLSPSTTTSASSDSTSAGSSSLSSPPQQKQPSLFIQMCDIMFPLPNKK